MVKSKIVNNLAKKIVETTHFDKESNTLFVSNPAINFDILKSLAKKHNFTIGQTSAGEYISIPVSQKYADKKDNFLLYDNFVDTYTYFDKNYNTLLSAYKTFDLMDENLSEVSLMLNTYASEALSQGFVDNQLTIKISNPEAQSLIEKVFYKNKIYQRLSNITRSIAKYGNYGMILQYPYLENWLSSDADIKNINVAEDLVITFVNPKDFEVNVDEFCNPINYKTRTDISYVTNLAKTNDVKKIWQPWQFVHFLIPDELTEPYGKSMLWSMRSAFDQLTYLEGLLALSRASKIQRLVFYIPIPDPINYIDAYGYLNEFRTQYLNSIFTDQGSAKAGRKIPGAMSILTLPVAKDGSKVSVDHIESNIDLSSIEDVNYFLDKILRSSALPKGYLVGEDVITTAQTLEAQDLKLRRSLIPLKRALLDGLMNLVENILAHAGYDVSKVDVEVSLNEPIQISSDTLQKYSDITDLLKSVSEINTNMTNINKFQFLLQLGMPKELAALICSNTSINTNGSSEDLANFLLNQNAHIKTNAFGLNETTKYSINSKTFLKQRATLTKSLSELKSLDRELLVESIKSKVE